MERIKWITNKIIEWPDDNTAGLVMSKDSIENVVIWCALRESEGNLIAKLRDNDSIDEQMGENESDCGYLIKASDFVSAFEVYEIEKPKRKKYFGTDITFKRIPEGLEINENLVYRKDLNIYISFRKI